MPENSDRFAMDAATRPIYPGQKTLPLQDRLSINALDFHAPIIDGSA
jgi:hypothetical protein